MIRFLCPLHGLIVAIRINGQISLLRDVNEIKSIMMENWHRRSNRLRHVSTKFRTFP